MNFVSANLGVLDMDFPQERFARGTHEPDVGSTVAMLTD